MSKGKQVVIDYLFEDPPISDQKYALISIVGPHMKQKCDVWGIKIRGVADSLDNAKSLCKRILNIDNNYDIYTVDIGKFFPLDIEPSKVKNVEYQNEQLNNLIRGYLENKTNADDLWNKRRAEMVEDAVREGKSQNNKSEHPVAVLNTINNLQNQIKETEEKLETLRERLSESTQQFENYTQDEQVSALEQFKNLVNQSSSQEINTTSQETDITVEEVSSEIQKM